MKLFVVLALTLLAITSVSGSLFKKKQPKLVDIHITKGQLPSQPGQAPVGQVPLGQYPYVSFLPESAFVVPVNHVSQVGHAQVSHVPLNKVPVGKVHGSLSVPVYSQHRVQVVPVHVEPQYFQPQLVHVEPNVQAVQLVFKSASSPLLVKQKHFSSPGGVYQTTQSEDYPHVLRHVVHKPVVQQVHEIVQPFRTITTQVLPVQERLNTILPVRKPGLQSPVQAGQHLQQKLHFPQFQYDQFRENQFFQEQYRFQQPPATKNPPPPQQQPIEQEPIQQEPIEQEPEPVEQHPVKGI